MNINNKGRESVFFSAISDAYIALFFFNILKEVGVQWSPSKIFEIPEYHYSYIKTSLKA